MNILTEGTDYHTAPTHTNVDRGTTAYRTPDTAIKTGTSGFALDISGTVMDNSAYTGHGQTAEEVMLEAGQEDITARRNYMAVMSNCMSDEDFARLQEEGFHPGSTDIETVVTIVDHIKTALVKGGTQVVGYTDTMSSETLREITGSETFARELEKQFAKQDLPLTQENVSSVMEAWSILEQAEYPTDGSIKYMVENALLPTPENFYTAKYSAAADTLRQGKGYYAVGEMAGYYAKKPETVDFDKILPQMQKLIEEAGYEVSKENLEDAYWLVEKGVPLNTDTFSLMKNIRNIQFPVSQQDFLEAAVSALSDGTKPSAADLNQTESNYEKAISLMEQTASIQEEAVDSIFARELPLTLKNLLAAQDIFLKSGSDLGKEKIRESIQGKRLLEEVRLSMSVEANLRLLKKGYQIETAPLQQLVEKLKEAETDWAKSLTGETDEAKAGQKASLYQETLDVLRGIRVSPAAVLSDLSVNSTLREVSAAGEERAAAYRKAGISYETLMTAPRQDMGDSIKKAFRNVDDILTDLEVELSDENRRAVRILGYNSIEITGTHIEEIRKMDDLLTGVVKEMKPARVLNMIREGIDPLIMPLEELQEYLGQQESPAEEMESYSKFLYKLEKKKDISKEERSAYIGIYKMLRQIEKADDASVGAVWQTGAEHTLQNLFSMVKSSKHKAMNYTVDDNFGGIRLRDFMEEAGEEEAGREYDRMVNDQIRTAVKSEDPVLQQLLNYQQPVTADYLFMAASMMRKPKEIWQQTERLTDREASFDSLEDAGEQILKALEGKEEAQNAYEVFCGQIQNVLDEQYVSEENSALDVRAMSTLYKQMTFLSNMAREENYEIPVNINGSLTSINLKIVHSGQQESRAAITLETQTLGKVAAEFKSEDQKLEGFCVCSTKEGTALLDEGKPLLETQLQKEEIPVGDIYFVTGENLDLTAFSVKQSADRQQGQEAGVLYKAARAFIGYIQQIEIKKGNMEYEN